MENKEVSKLIKKSTPPIDLDEIDLENLTFKPLTQGLGFHHEKREIPIIKSRVSNPRPNPSLRSTVPHSIINSTNIIAPKPTPIPKKVEEDILTEPTITLRTISFGVDLLVILVGTAITLSVLWLASGLPLEILISIFSLHEIILFTTSVFSIYFLFYFSVLDLSSTVGKSIMGLENKTLEGNRPNISNTFTRSLITLISLPLFGLPIIGEFQTKISGIKVYKRKCPY